MDRSLPCPQRQRVVPPQFSWIDQALARRRFFERASASAWALYCFAVTVADARGVSFYAERTLCERLAMPPEQLRSARRALLDLDLIAVRAPLLQVLSMPPPRPTPTADARAHLARLRQCLSSPQNRR